MLKLLALLLMDAMTVVVAPAAKVPLAAERVTQLCPLAALQLIEVPPIFWRVWAWLDGLKGPPELPEEDSPVEGVTEREPIAAKLAMIDFGPFMVTEVGFVDPERSPDQPVKL